nr:reverse transcriptase domain-containing protein [Tanacetum cinerariifolium]
MSSSQRTKALSKSKGSAGGHWKSKPKRQKSSVEDDLSQPWVCEETDPFTPRIRYFDFLKTRMPSHIKTCDGNEDLEDHLKIFHAAAKMERWAMPTKNASNIRSKFTISSKEMGNPRNNSCGGRIPKPTKARAKARQIHPPHKNTKRNIGFGQREVQVSSSNDNPGRKEKRQQILRISWGSRHITNECMHLKRQIEEMLKAGKLSHLIKKLKQNSRKDSAKAAKKGETSRKEKPRILFRLPVWILLQRIPHRGQKPDDSFNHTTGQI